MHPKISAIILNYRNLADTINCVNSLLQTDSGKSLDIIVVDNSQTPATRKSLKRTFPQICYIESPSNLGFAGGNNLGIKRALTRGSTHVLIVNPDVTFNHAFFVPLLNHFKAKDIGIVAPAICHTQKDKKMYGLDGKVSWDLAKPTHRNLTKITNQKVVVSEFVTFACVLISRETFEKVGLLDDGYFMYFEDVDYCLSAGKVGLKIILDPAVTVSHRTSSSFKHPTQKLKISFISQLRFINKWLPPLRRVKPILYALTLYPYLYFLWTHHEMKYKKV